MTDMQKNQRTDRLVNPRLQLKVVFLFLVVSVLAVGIQSVLMSRSLATLTQVEGGTEEVYGLLRENLFVTLAALLPATMIVGVITTFRIAGPLFRFQEFLESIERGENPADCKIRRTDDLHEFCEVLNRVSRPWRTAADVKAEATATREVGTVPSLVAEPVPEPRH